MAPTELLRTPCAAVEPFQIGTFWGRRATPLVRCVCQSGIGSAGAWESPFSTVTGKPGYLPQRNRRLAPLDPRRHTIPHTARAFATSVAKSSSLEKTALMPLDKAAFSMLTL